MRVGRRALGRALLVGVGVIAVLGFVSEAPGLPTVLLPTAVVAALAMALGESSPVAAPAKSVPRLWAFVPVAAAVAVSFALVLAVPGWTTSAAVRQARAASRLADGQERDMARERGAKRTAAVLIGDDYLRSRVLAPLGRAIDADPRNAPLLLEYARWLRPHWRHALTLNEGERAAQVAERIGKCCSDAMALDPHNLAGRRAAFAAVETFLTDSRSKPAERVKVLDAQAEAIARRHPEEEVALRLRIVRGLLVHDRPAELEEQTAKLFRAADSAGGLDPREAGEIAAAIAGGLRRGAAAFVEMAGIEEWNADDADSADRDGSDKNH